MTQLCGICGKPVMGEPHPNADVFHMACMMEDLREVREQLQQRLKRHETKREKKGVDAQK